MAKDNWIPERLIQYIISNKNVPYREQWLEKWKQDMSYLSRAVESASPEGKFFQTKPKEINPNRESPDYGLGEQRIIIDASSEGTVSPSLLHANEFLSIARDWEDGYDIQKREVPLVKGKKTIVGKEAFEIAKNSIRAKGGDLRRKPTEADPNQVQFYYPFPDDEEMHGAEWVASPEGGSKLNRYPTTYDKRRVTNRIFSAASKKSDETEAKIAEEAAAKEEAKRQKEEAKEKKENEKEEKEQRQKSNRFFAHVLSWLSNIYNKLVQLALGSFRTAVAAEVKGVETRTAGVSAPERREMDLFDRAHGMKEGQTFASIQEIQRIAGDVTNIDEKAIGTFARVVGEEIKGLVRSGIGEADPQKFMELVLDKYFLAFKEGKNSYGQYVGREQARQNLYLSLQDVAPNLAALFARMADDYSSNYYGEFNSVAEWRNTTETNRTGLTGSEIQFREEQAKALNALNATIADLKDAFLTGVVSKLSTFIDMINNSRLFMSDENKIAFDLKNRRENEETKRTAERQNELYLGVLNEGFNKFTSTYTTPTKLNPKDIKDFEFTPEQIAKVMSNTATTKELQDMTGLKGTALEKWQSRAFEIGGALLTDKRTADSFARLINNITVIDRIEEQNAKTKNVDKIGNSVAQQTVASMQWQEWVSNTRDLNKPLLKGSAFWSNTAGTRQSAITGMQNYYLNEPTGINELYSHINALTGGNLYKYYDLYRDKGTLPIADKNILGNLTNDKKLENALAFEKAQKEIKNIVAEKEAKENRTFTEDEKRNIEVSYLLNTYLTEERYGSIYDNTYFKRNIFTDQKQDEHIRAKSVDEFKHISDTGFVRLLSDFIARTASASIPMERASQFIGEKTKQGEYIIRLVDKEGKNIINPVSLGMLDSAETFTANVEYQDGRLILKNAGGQ